MFCIQVIKLVISNTTLEEYEKVYFAEHPKAKKKPIAQPYHESINQWMIMKRPMMNALKQRWKDFIVWFIQNSEYCDTHIEECEIKFITYYGIARRHDIDNGCPKFILDGLCDSGFIIDDDSKHITSLTMQCFVDVDSPRTEIEVYVSKKLTHDKFIELKEAKSMAAAKKAVKKNKKVSISSLDTVMKDTYIPSKTVNWNGVDVTVVCTLSMNEMLNFVDSVVKSCFDGVTGEYRPEAKEFAMRVNIMTRYANFALPERNVEHQYELAMCSGAVEMIMEHISPVQFCEMKHAIDRKIEHIAAANVHALNMKFDEVVTKFDQLQSKIEDMFSGVSVDDVQKLTGALANTNFNEEKLVEAIMSRKAPVENEN